MNIIENYKLGPYNVKIRNPSEFDEVNAYDIKGAYRSIMINNDVPYNVFYVHSRIIYYSFCRI